MNLFFDVDDRDNTTFTNFSRAFYDCNNDCYYCCVLFFQVS